MDNEKRYKVLCVPEKMSLFNIHSLSNKVLFYRGSILYYFEWDCGHMPEEGNITCGVQPEIYQFVINRIFYSTDLKEFHKFIGYDKDEKLILDDGDRIDSDVSWSSVFSVDDDMLMHPFHSKVLDVIGILESEFKAR